mmetsp:Transcript_56562/g.177121  ORF Transcript_56562/g.177121 Transcript_56562/m.177121 type:complete len:157 (+) Transcript_56562:108-578(+)
MAPAAVQEMGADPESGPEAEEALLGEQPAMRLRRLFMLGSACVGLLVAALALWGGSRHLRTVAAPSSLQQWLESDELPAWCHGCKSCPGWPHWDCASGPGRGAEAWFVTPASWCVKYADHGRLAREVANKSSCDLLNSNPVAYLDVLCCPTDPCNE